MSELLEIAARVLEAVTPPGGAFDPRGPWRHTYGVYDLGADLAARKNAVRNLAGTLRISRSPLSGGGSLLDIDLQRRTPPRTEERISGHMKCAPGVLASPTEWDFDWEARTPGQSGSLKRKRAGNVALSSPYTANWALFDVVQRLEPKPAEPLRFTLLDEFDLVKPNQNLAFRKTTEVTLAKGPVTLNAFEQFGDGVLPVMYWTDDQGRLLFAISGLIAYAMKEDTK